MQVEQQAQALQEMACKAAQTSERAKILRETHIPAVFKHVGVSDLSFAENFACPGQCETVEASLEDAFKGLKITFVLNTEPQDFPKGFIDHPFYQLACKTKQSDGRRELCMFCLELSNDDMFYELVLVTEAHGLDIARRAAVSSGAPKFNTPAELTRWVLQNAEVSERCTAYAAFSKRFVFNDDFESSFPKFVKGVVFGDYLSLQAAQAQRPKPGQQESAQRSNPAQQDSAPARKPAKRSAELAELGSLLKQRRTQPPDTDVYRWYVYCLECPSKRHFFGLQLDLPTFEGLLQSILHKTAQHDGSADCRLAQYLACLRRDLLSEDPSRALEDDLADEAEAFHRADLVRSYASRHHRRTDVHGDLAQYVVLYGYAYGPLHALLDEKALQVLEPAVDAAQGHLASPLAATPAEGDMLDYDKFKEMLGSHSLEPRGAASDAQRAAALAIAGACVLTCWPAMAEKSRLDPAKLVKVKYCLEFCALQQVLPLALSPDVLMLLADDFEENGRVKGALRKDLHAAYCATGQAGTHPENRTWLPPPELMERLFEVLP